MTQRNYFQFVAGLFKPGTDILPTLFPAKIEMLHAAIGIMGEAVEARNNTGRDNLLEELGDLTFYTVAMANTLDITDELEAVSTDYSPEYSDLSVNELFEILLVKANEVLDQTKKLVIYNKSPFSVLASLKVLVTDISALTIAIGVVSSISFPQILEHNRSKLGKRYEAGYSDAAAQARADKQ